MPPPIFFGLVGAASTNIDVALYLLLTSAEYTSPVLANALSYGLAAISSFVLNKLITFRHRRLQTRAIMQVGAFALVRLLCFAISTVALTLGLLVMPKLAAKLVSIVITFFFAYNLSSRLVYR